MGGMMGGNGCLWRSAISSNGIMIVECCDNSYHLLLSYKQLQKVGQ